MKLGAQIIGLIMTATALFDVNHSMEGIKSNALIKLTAFMDAISGSVAGTVFARNKGGAYAKSKSNPTNPQTVAQQTVRAAFASIAQSWRGLANQQRAAWDAATDDYPYQNRLGETKTYSGSALHQSLNLNLNSIGVSPITAPLLPTTVAQLTNLSVVANASAGTMVATAGFATNPGSVTCAVFATESSSAGRTNLKNRLRKIAIVDGSALSGTDLYTDYVAIFGVPISGAKIAYEIRTVNKTTGQGTAPYYIVQIVL